MLGLRVANSGSRRTTMDIDLSPVSIRAKKRPPSLAARGSWVKSRLFRALTHGPAAPWTYHGVHYYDIYQQDWQGGNADHAFMRFLNDSWVDRIAYRGPSASRRSATAAQPPPINHARPATLPCFAGGQRDGASCGSAGYGGTRSRRRLRARRPALFVRGRQSGVRPGRHSR